MKYLDISKYQPLVKYDLLKADGIDGVIIRRVSSNSGGLYIDPYFDTHYAGCKSAGVPVGAYLFSYATNAAQMETEVDLFLQAIAGKKFELPIILDYETKYDKMTKQERTTVIKYGLQLIEKAGYYAMWYTYKDFFKNLLLPDQLKSYDFWLAWYTALKPVSRLYNNFGMWQYTSTGKISAVSGNVDLSHVYKDYPTIIKNSGLNGYDKPTPSPDPAPVSDLQQIRNDLNSVKLDIENIINYIDTVLKN